MKKIWSKNGRSRPKSKYPDDDLSLAPTDTDLASSVHVRSLIQPEYDSKLFKHAWVNAVFNSLSRDFSESQLKLFRLELRGSHLYFYRPPALVDARLFTLDTLHDLARTETSSAASLGKLSMDMTSTMSGNGTLTSSTANLNAGETTMLSSASVSDFSSLKRSESTTLSSPLVSPEMSSQMNNDNITYFSTEIPHPGLKFDPKLKTLQPSSSPEALVHFFLFADAEDMAAPLRTLLCVMPMLSGFVRVLRLLHMYIVAIYDDKFGMLVSHVDATQRILQLFGHIDRNFGGFFLKADTASFLLKFFDTFARSAPAELEEEIAKFKSDMLGKQEKLLALVNSSTNAVANGPGSDPLSELNLSVFLNEIGLFDLAEAITGIDLQFFESWNSSIDKSLLLSSSIMDNAPGDVLYKKNPLIFNNLTHVHYLSRLLVHHLFVESPNTTPELRARLLEKWIDLGCLLDKLGNMSLWLGISSVILLQPILRLTSVWRHVSDDYITLLRKDWALVLFELDRRHLATPFESVTFSSTSGTDMQTTFKDSFHIMAPRGLGKIYPKSRIIPYFGDLLVNNIPSTPIEELDSVWKKIDYSFERWNEYLLSLQDSEDLISFNQDILRHYDANGFIFSNQSLNQVLCLGVKKDMLDNIPQVLKGSESDALSSRICAKDIGDKLHRLIGLNCDSINLESIMKYSLEVEAAAPEKYLRGPEWAARNSESALSVLSDLQSTFFDVDGDNSSIYSSRLSGTKAEDKLPLFQSQSFKINFSKYDAAPSLDSYILPPVGVRDTLEIDVDKELTLQKALFTIDLDCSLIEELGKMNDIFSDDENHEGLGIDVDNILNYEKFKNFSLEDLTDAKDEEWVDESTKNASINETQSKEAAESKEGTPQYFPKYASVDRLIDLLIVDPRYFHNCPFVNLSEYRTAFMLNYSTFITTRDLIQRLAHRFIHSGNAVISVMKRQYLIRNKTFDAVTFGAYPNWEFDKDVNLTVLGSVDYELLLKIQTNILKVLIVLVNNFFSSFLNDLANKRVMIKLLKLYSNEILQWYNSSKIDRDLDKSFENLVAYYKRLKKAFIMKTYRPVLPPKIDEFLLLNHKFSNTLTEVPVNRNLPSHKNIQKIEKFLNKFNEVLGSFYKGITPQHWFSVFKLLESMYENNTLLNYKSQLYSISEEAVQISNVYDYLVSVYDTGKKDLLFSKLPLVFQTLIRLYSKFKSYLLIQLCDPLINDDERLDRMRTLLLMAKICKLKMSELEFVLEGDSNPIPSFIEAAITNAIYSPESRYFAKLWVKAASSLNPGVTKKFDLLEALIPFDISADDLATGHEPLLPCIGWVVENMLDLSKIPSYHASLIDFNKRYILFKFVKELIVEDASMYSNIHTELKEFEFLFLLDENLSHMLNVSYDINDQYPRDFFEKIIKKQYSIIALEAQRSGSKSSRFGNDSITTSGPKTLSRKVSNSSLRRQSLNFKATASAKFRLGGLFTKPKGFGLGSSSDRNVNVRDLPNCSSVADVKQKPSLVIPLKDRKIFPVYLLPACFKIDSDNSNEICFVQATSEADAQDWLRKLNYANRHWFQSRSINTKSSHMCTTFGIPLDLICARDGTEVPAVLTTIFDILEKDGLKDVGIYRIGTSMSELNNLKLEIDRTGTISVVENSFDVHALTGCVKLFFRELPDALLTDDVIENLQPLKQRSKDLGEADILAYKELLAKLPSINYYTLRALIKHLNRVYMNRDHNKMNLSNLATVIGPALTEASTMDSLINNFGVMNNILEKLIENYEPIFAS